MNRQAITVHRVRAHALSGQAARPDDAPDVRALPAAAAPPPPPSEVSCDRCTDGRAFTPKGLAQHLRRAHKVEPS